MLREMEYYEVTLNAPGVDGSGAVLDGLCVRHSNLMGARMRGVCLKGAVLEGCNMSLADLSGADLSRASLAGSDLTNADLSGQSHVLHLITHAHSHTHLIPFPDFLSPLSHFAGANLTNTTLTNANLTNANLCDSNLTNAMTSGVNMIGANTTNVTGYTGTITMHNPTINPSARISGNTMTASHNDVVASVVIGMRLVGISYFN